MMLLPSRPLLMVLSAPSGGGKTTIGEALLRKFPQMQRSVSCTTRPPRPGELPGRDYHFLDETEFQARAKAGEFLEQAAVHAHFYGTLRKSVLDALAIGQDILLTIDVQGAARVRAMAAGDTGALRKAFVDVFVVPPDSAALQRRLRARGTESEESLALRLKNAELEIEQWRDYRYVVVNDRLEDAVEAMVSIIKAEHCRVLE